MIQSLDVNRGKLHICKDSAELAEGSALEFINVVKDAISKRGLATIALSGGHTPHILYERVLKDDLRSQVDWTKVHFFVGDERSVPFDSEENNFGNAFRQFLSKLNLPEANLHPTKGQEKSAQESAANYEQELKTFFHLKDGEFPKFDMIHLGMGPDGHCASLFPGTNALTERTRLVVGNHVDKLSTDRITFTYPVINNAQYVMFMVEGAEKAPVLAEALQSPKLSYPVQGIDLVDGRLDWFVDEAAAQEIKIPR